MHTRSVPTDTILVQLNTASDTSSLADTLANHVPSVLQISNTGGGGILSQPGFWISVLSLLVAFATLFYQFLWWGRLAVGEVSSFGLWINYSGGRGQVSNDPQDWYQELLQKQQGPNGAPNALLVVLPLVLWNTGNSSKGILNLRLKADFGNGPIVLKANQFVEDMGLDEDGGHKYPQPINWVHNFIVQPRDSVQRYISFFGRVNDGEVELEKGETIRFGLELKTTDNTEFTNYNTFIVSSDDLISNYGASDYTVYFTKRAGHPKSE